MRATLVIVAVLSAAPAAADPTLFSSGTPHPGMTRQTWKDPAVPLVIHVLRVDLTSAEIGLVATAEPDKGQTALAYEMQQAAVAAINGDAFSASGYVPHGLAAGTVGATAATWTNTADDATSAVFHFARIGEQTFAAIEPPQLIDTLASLPTNTQGVVSGRPLLVQAGTAVTQFDCTDAVAQPCDVMPRSALGLSQDGYTLWLVVADGWQASSAGMSAGALAAFFQTLGAYMAVALDGGGSSTLVLDDNVISSPSDGVPRTVANHLAVRYQSLPRGELYGLICKNSVIDCAADSSRWISGAEVRLDDGRMVTTDASASYDFKNVTQRIACVTVKKAGYKTAYKCSDMQVLPMGLTYNSVPLFAGTDPIDAGVVDAHDEIPDAPVGSDHGDAGNPQMGPGGGCCEAGHGGPPIALCALVALFLTRRRGTTV